jgi:TM2 domain-containing membrane protein YozV
MILHDLPVLWVLNLLVHKLHQITLKTIGYFLLPRGLGYNFCFSVPLIFASSDLLRLILTFSFDRLSFGFLSRVFLVFCDFFGA